MGRALFVVVLAGSGSRLKQAALVLAALGLVLGVIAAGGQVMFFDPLTVGGLSFGVPVLGLALFLADSLSLGPAGEKKDTRDCWDRA